MRTLTLLMALTGEWLDALSTYLAVSLGVGVEANPSLQIINDMPYMSFLVAGIQSLVLLVVWCLGSKFYYQVSYALLAHGTFKIVVSINNFMAFVDGTFLDFTVFEIMRIIALSVAVAVGTMKNIVELRRGYA